MVQKFYKGKKLYTFDENELNLFLTKHKENIKAAIVDSPSPFLSVLKQNSVKHIVICSSKKIKRPMHDLDILAESGYFQDGSKIPELPFVGMLFAEKDCLLNFINYIFLKKVKQEYFLMKPLKS